jgi:predicted dinucleotide-binding enzyme
MTTAGFIGRSLASSELLLRYFPDAMLVKAFNTIFFKHLQSLARPAGAADRSYQLVRRVICLHAQAREVEE